MKVITNKSNEEKAVYHLYSWFTWFAWTVGTEIYQFLFVQHELGHLGFIRQKVTPHSLYWNLKNYSCHLDFYLFFSFFCVFLLSEKS